MVTLGKNLQGCSAGVCFSGFLGDLSSLHPQMGKLSALPSERRPSPSVETELSSCGSLEALQR